MQTYVMDGAVYGAMTRHLRAYHGLAYDADMGLLDKALCADSILKLTDFDLYLRCVSHSLQLDIVWSIKPWCDDGVEKKRPSRSQSAPHIQ